MSSKHKIMIDEERLVTEVRQKAKEYLDEISEDNLKSFAEATKYIAQSILENYFLGVDSLYTNGNFKIQEQNIFDKFIDFHDGYRSKMRRWVSNHEIRLGEMKISPSIVYPEMSNHDLIQKPLAIAGVGTLIAVGLYIFTNAWIVAAAELLTLGTAAYVYKQSKEKSSKDFEYRVKRYELQIEQERARLINGLIKDLKQWLQDAVSYSDSILTELGVC